MASATPHTLAGQADVRDLHLGRAQSGKMGWRTDYFKCHVPIKKDLARSGKGLAGKTQTTGCALLTGPGTAVPD